MTAPDKPTDVEQAKARLRGIELLDQILQRSLDALLDSHDRLTREVEELREAIIGLRSAHHEGSTEDWEAAVARAYSTGQGGN